MKIICLEFFGGSSKNENSKLLLACCELQKMKIQKSEFRAWGYCEAAKPTRWGTGACEARSLKPWSLKLLHIYFVHMYSVYKTWGVQSLLWSVGVYDLKFMTWSLWLEVYDLEFMTWSLWLGVYDFWFFICTVYIRFMYGVFRGAVLRGRAGFGGLKKRKGVRDFLMGFLIRFFWGFWVKVIYIYLTYYS